MTEMGVVKACVSCGKNLNGQQRMKDSAGRYWCMECGAEDQRKKRASSTDGNACSSCGQTFPAHELSVWGSRRLCPGCSPSNRKGPGITATITGLFSGMGSGGGYKSKMIKMLAVMILLAAIAAYINFG